MVKNRGPMTQLRKDFLNFLESDPFFGVKKNGVPIRKLGEVKLLWKIYCSALPSNSDLIDFFQYPYHPCMVYLPTFGWCWWQMQVNMPYMDAMGYQFLFERSPFKPQKTNRTPSGITPWFLRKGLVHPDKFISTTPHMTFAHGEEQIAWLKKRASKKHACWLRVDFWGFTVRGIHNPPVLVMFFSGDMNIQQSLKRTALRF